ncbi:MAG: tetraacyldisaccharide 4'-kinase [Alphaproteobacteria bacterium]|nr:MAG: tetraacyldisaccharide 4'-kinase [Alphaproteobacteria bacterium]
MNLNLLSGVAALSLVCAACSEPASQDETTAPEPVLVTPVTPGPNVTDDLDSFVAKCDADFTRLKARVEAIEAFKGPYTVDSVMVPLNDLDTEIGNAYYWPYIVTATQPDEAYRDAAMACVQKFIPLFNDLGLSQKIYHQVKAIDLTGADQVTTFMVEETIKSYESSGVDKDDQTRARIKAINEETFRLSQLFDKNIRDDVRYVEVEDVARLSGLPEDYIAGHQPDENGIIKISTSYPDMFPVFSYADDDQLRYDMRMANGNRGYPVNEEVLRDLLKKRKELAQILGYQTFAHLTMEDRMIGTPERADAFIKDINALVRGTAELERDRLLERYRQIDPEAEMVMPWQRGYISEKLRAELYAYDSQQVRQYFQFDNVKAGIFQLTQDLFGVEIRDWDTPVWDPQVSAHEMVENGQVIGRFYLDLHPRAGKDQHATHYTLRVGVKGKQIPMSVLVTNFPGGDGTAGLMEHTQVETFLHEFGHLIHNMFSGTQTWAYVAGMSMERDFVEAPSQMLEEWVWDYETLKSFAINTDGEVLPRELFDKMLAARNFNRATGVAGQTYLAAESLQFHIADPETLDFDAVSNGLWETYSVYPTVPGTHGWASFGHLGGYSSNYYTYQWSLAIAADMFTRFEAEGLRNKATAMDYRTMVLGSAGSRPADEMLEEFLGRPFTVEAYAEDLKEAAQSAQ